MYLSAFRAFDATRVSRIRGLHNHIQCPYSIILRAEGFHRTLMCDRWVCTSKVYIAPRISRAALAYRVFQRMPPTPASSLEMPSEIIGTHFSPASPCCAWDTAFWPSLDAWVHRSEQRYSRRLERLKRKPITLRAICPHRGPGIRSV